MPHRHSNRWKNWHRHGAGPLSRERGREAIHVCGQPALLIAARVIQYERRVAQLARWQKEGRRATL